MGKLLNIIFLCSLILISACSNNDSDKGVMNLLKEDTEDEDIDTDDIIQFTHSDYDLYIYPKEDKNIQIYVFNNQKVIHSLLLNLDELSEEKIYWVYSELEDTNESFIIGGIDKQHTPFITISEENNEKEFNGNIISLNNAYVFFSFYDESLSYPIDVAFLDKVDVK